MNSRLLICALSILFISLIGWGCSIDRIEGSQLAGQECGNEADCAQGLTCVERRCRPVGHGAVDDIPDAGDSDIDPGQPETGIIIPDAEMPPPRPDAEHFPDTRPSPHDTGQTCTVGETRCASPEITEQCVGSEQGTTQWVERPCPSGESCIDGLCTIDCGPDQVYNPIVGECVDEDEECCPGGCGDGELCHQCACQAYDPATCQYQNQPCESEGQFSNGYMCARYGEFSDLRCFGLCNPPAADPDSTCPEPDSICLYEDTSQPNGSCVTDCSIGDPCGDDGMGCIHHAAGTKDGICLPSTGTGQVGDPCNPDDFLDCADEAVCVGGICRQSCRPFDLNESDCTDGSCLAFSHELGMCTTDTNLDDGSCTADFTTCGDDATGCFQSFEGGGLTCYDFCRLQLDDDDCADGYTCFQHDIQNDFLGMCTEEMTMQ